MANSNSEITPGLGSISTEEMLRNLNRNLLGESKGYMSELSRLDDPVKVKDAINEVSASSIGLPSVNIFSETVNYKIENGDIVPEVSHIQMVSGPELMKIFIDPDWSAGSKDAGYQANVSINMAINSTSRDEVIKGLKGPGKFGIEDATHYVDKLVESKQLEKNNRDKAIKMIVGSVKPEAQEVVKVLIDAAPVVKARAEFWRAYGDYAQTGGDEKPGADIFKSPGHGAPTGPDFQAFFPKNDVEMDRVMRQIYAIGVPYNDLVAQGKEEYLVEGIHYKMENGQRKIINNNVYVNGFTSDNFKVWIGSLLDKTNGNLLKAYDAWYSSIAMGLVAKVAIEGVKIGDPPWVSSADTWYIHFGKKQLAEAGLDENGKRQKLATYTAKTGPLASIGKYPDSLIGSFFDNATIGQTGTSIFDQWWNNKTDLGDIPWLVLGQEIGKSEEEVKINSFDGYLNKKMQLFKLLDTIQNVPSLGDICKYTFWQSTARTLDKALGVAYDLDNTKNRTKAIKNGIINPDVDKVTKDGVDFIKMVPDEKNPRMTLIEGLLMRYNPDVKDGALKSLSDTSVDQNERFNILSQSFLNSMAGQSIKSLHPGVPIENFLISVIDSTLLTSLQALKVLRNIYKDIVVKDIINNSPRLKSMLGKQ